MKRVRCYKCGQIHIYTEKDVDFLDVPWGIVNCKSCKASDIVYDNLGMFSFAAVIFGAIVFIIYLIC